MELGAEELQFLLKERSPLTKPLSGKNYGRRDSGLVILFVALSTEREMSDWSFIPQTILNSVIGTIKRAGCWKIDGPSLRSLNRHWSAAVNLHIVEVHPSAKRVIGLEDIDSLSKFPNLTRLDAVPFESKDASQLAERCLRLVRVLSKREHLTHLRQSYLFDQISDDNLELLHSLETIEFENDRCFDDDVSDVDESLLEGCTESAFGSPDNFIEKMAYLKVLLTKKGHLKSKTVTFKPPNEQPYSSKRSLTVYSIAIATVAGSHKTIETPTGTTSVADWLELEFDPEGDTCIQLLDHLPRNLERLIGFHNLASMSFRAVNTDIRIGSAFQQLLPRLRSLKIYGEHLQRALPSDSLTDARVLEELLLDGFIVEQKLIENLRDLPLRSLALVHCRFLEAECFPSSWTTLGRLDIRRSRFHFENHFDLSLPSNLTSLGFSFGADSQEQGMLDQLSRLVLLESLEIQTFDLDRDFSFFERLGDLPCLRSKRLRSISFFLQKPDLAKLTKMSYLSRLKHLKFSVRADPEDQAYLEGCLKKLRRGVRHAEIELKLRNVKKWGFVA